MRSFRKPLLTLSALFLATGAIQAQASNKSGVDVPAQPEFNRSDATAFGRQIAEYADRFDQGWKDEVWQGKMTLYDARGDSVERRTVRMALEDAEEGDKIIVRFLSPAEVKGVSALTHEHPLSTDDNWLYLPASRRVRRISGANKTASFQGTEFTYEDLSTLIIVKYDWRFLEEATFEQEGKQVKVFKVEAKPNFEDTGYSRLVVWYNQDSWRQDRIEYYDKANQLLKVLDSGGWEHVHGRFWRPGFLEIRNAQTQKRTRIDVEKRFLNLSLYKSSKTGKARANLSEEQFTTRALEGRG